MGGSGCGGRMGVVGTWAVIVVVVMGVGKAWTMTVVIVVGGGENV